VERPSVAQSVAKLAIAGGQAGISFREIIHMLSTTKNFAVNPAKIPRKT
jgi:hypothetical protein